MAQRFNGFDFGLFADYSFLHILYTHRGAKTMPIFEFRCLKCGHIFEKLFINSDEKTEIACPECESDSFERVVSRTSYVMGGGPGWNKPKVTTKSCSPGSQCGTLELPGPSK